jgi:hypothetical protein
MSTQQEIVERALAYPYAVPARSYLLAGPDPGGVREIAPTEAETAGRAPLLAYGSNAAPEALARKLGETASAAPVVALRATLAGFDVVYSAHISRYGSVPATLRRSPGTETTVFVLHLTAEQLRLVETTEPNYERVELREVSCRVEGGATLTELDAYASRHGCLTIDGSPVALAEIAAAGRKLRAMSQRQVQEHVRATLAPDRSLERFVAENASQPQFARARGRELRAMAAPIEQAPLGGRSG